MQMTIIFFTQYPRPDALGLDARRATWVSHASHSI